MSDATWAILVLAVGLLMVAVAALHDYGHPRLRPLVFATGGAFLAVFAMGALVL